MHEDEGMNGLAQEGAVQIEPEGDRQPAPAQPPTEAVTAEEFAAAAEKAAADAIASRRAQAAAVLIEVITRARQGADSLELAFLRNMKKADVEILANEIAKRL